MHKLSSAAAVIDYILEDSTNDQIKGIFELFDADGDGMIQRRELIDVLGVCAHEIGLEVDDYLEQVADAVFSHANQSDAITFECLQEVLKNRPNLLNELSLARDLHQSRRRDPLNICDTTSKLHTFANYLSRTIPALNKLRWEYISNNLARTSFFLALIIISSLLIIGRIISYWEHCGFLILARASGQCLNFFSSIIVLLVCRRSVSFLRSKGFGRYLPLDDHVYFHKVIGMFIVLHSISHTLGHIFNFLKLSREIGNQHSLGEYLISPYLGIGWIGGVACITGWILLVIIIIMSLAQPFSRSLGKFELFYYTHLLYIPYWALLFVHAPRFWIWFIIPFCIFLVEFLIRLRNFITNLTSQGQTTIIKAVPLPSDVIHLVIKRPPNFEYNPGDWIYVLIPQIAKYEWHPFTISSAPEQEGIIWLHIRAVGEWTRCLRSYFENMENRNHLRKFIKSGQFSLSLDNFGYGQSDLSQMDSTKILGANKLRPNKTLSPIPEHGHAETIEMTAAVAINDSAQTNVTSESTTGANGSMNASNSSNKSNRPMPNITIFIDGPYGSPSSQIFRAEHAVLIATGIGVTPFASILQSLVRHFEKRRQKCPNCLHEFSDTRPPFVCKLRKVDFVWINRDQKSFEWFIKLLAELELTQTHLPPNERFLDIHIHLTAMEPAKMKSIGLQLALYLVHEKNKKDLVTGLRTRTRAGRPDWDNFFENILDQKKGKVSVFFCGRPQLGRLLHRKCDSFGFKFRKEIF